MQRCVDGHHVDCRCEGKLARFAGECEPFGHLYVAVAASYGVRVTVFRLGEAAELFEVSVDTVRRWVEPGTYQPSGTDTGTG
jgi:hypothetical protein